MALTIFERRKKGSTHREEKAKERTGSVNVHKLSPDPKQKIRLNIIAILSFFSRIKQ